MATVWSTVYVPEFPEYVTVGEVLSTLTMTDDELVSSSPSVAEQVSVVPAVSADNVAGPQPVEEEMPDSGSLTVHVTVVLLTYQPLFPRVPVTVDGITGGVVSAAGLHSPVLPAAKIPAISDCIRARLKICTSSTDPFMNPRLSACPMVSGAPAAGIT